MANKKLQDQVKSQLMLSLGLQVEQKEELLKLLPTLSKKQLKQLREVFREENKRKEALLSSFFEAHPGLYPDYDRLAKKQVNSVYRDVEAAEEADLEERMKELLKASF